MGVSKRSDMHSEPLTRGLPSCHCLYPGSLPLQTRDIVGTCTSAGPHVAKLQIECFVSASPDTRQVRYSLFSTQHWPLLAILRATSSCPPLPFGVPRKLTKGSQRNEVTSTQEEKGKRRDIQSQDRIEIRIVHLGRYVGIPFWQGLSVCDTRPNKE
jgi:hypothetical protein